LCILRRNTKILARRSLNYIYIYITRISKQKNSCGEFRKDLTNDSYKNRHVGVVSTQHRTQHETNNESEILCQQNRAENLSFLMETFSIWLLCVRMRSCVMKSCVCVCVTIIIITVDACGGKMFWSG